MPLLASSRFSVIYLISSPAHLISTSVIPISSPGQLPTWYPHPIFSPAHCPLPSPWHSITLTFSPIIRGFRDSAPLQPSGYHDTPPITRFSNMIAVHLFQNPQSSIQYDTNACPRLFIVACNQRAVTRILPIVLSFTPPHISQNGSNMFQHILQFVRKSRIWIVSGAQSGLESFFDVKLVEESRLKCWLEC